MEHHNGEIKTHDGESFGVVRSAIDQARSGASHWRHGAGQVAERLPEAVDGVRDGARITVATLQTRPDSELALLAVGSLGVGVGLRLAGASRPATLVALIPAAMAGYSIVSRRYRARLTVTPIRPE